MATIKDAVLNGAELIRELAKTGTSASKLALARHVLGFIHRKERRVATANEVVDAMEQAGLREPFLNWPPTPPLTLAKALALAATGKWEGPVDRSEPAVEDQILALAPGAALPAEPERPAAEQAAAADAAPAPATLAESLELRPAKRPARPKKAEAEAPATA